VPISPDRNAGGSRSGETVQLLLRMSHYRQISWSRSDE
jgi:hypothetical protein